jgi:capreomycidine synthase
MSKFPVAKLEDWYRDNYFTTEIDISGSGVRDYSLGEARRMAGISYDDLDALVLQDSRTLGAPGLRAAIAARYPGASADQVIVTNGSSEAVFNIMKALLAPGDEVVLMDPHYHSYVSIARVIGCEIKVWQLRFEDGFVPSLDELNGLLGERTRMVIVNFPHNPTGASLSCDDQRRLVDMVAARGAYLMWDAAFADLIYGDDKLLGFHSLYDRSITVNTLSKAYGLPGLRVGWAVASPAVIEQCIRIRDFTVLFTSPLVELIAEKVLASADSFIAPRFEQARRNLTTLTAWLDAHRDSVEYVAPRGGVTVFARFKGIADIDAFCSGLIASRNVLLCPGSCFGRPELVRIGFGGAPQDLQLGLERLSSYIAQTRSHARPAA